MVVELAVDAGGVVVDGAAVVVVAGAVVVVVGGAVVVVVAGAVVVVVGAVVVVVAGGAAVVVVAGAVVVVVAGGAVVVVVVGGAVVVVVGGAVVVVVGGAVVVVVGGAVVVVVVAPETWTNTWVVQIVPASSMYTPMPAMEKSGSSRFRRWPSERMNASNSGVQSPDPPTPTFSPHFIQLAGRYGFRSEPEEW